MKMTTGITLLIIGFLTFVAGAGFIYSARATNQKIIIFEAVVEPIGQVKVKEPDMKSNILIFENLISMATVDGILTPNEVKQLKTKADELGLRYNDYSKTIDESLRSSGRDPETKKLDKKKEKGNDFEAFIVRKFSKKYFKLLDWAGDKYVEGIYAETTLQPDLKMRFKFTDVEVDFAVECKYRSFFPSRGFEWCTQSQLKNYRNFAKEKNMPVFLALGIGGLASQPEELFIVPLAKIETVLLSRDFLKIYRKWNFRDKDLYFNFDKLSLN
jgi:hypothetical protein